MKGFICGVCGFVSIDGKAPEKCPVCGAPKSAFKEDNSAIKEPENPSQLSELEKKHIPVIKISKACGLIEGCVDASAMMGEIKHPMEEAHHIMFVDFYVDKKWVARSHLSADVNPAAGVHLKAMSGKLSVVSFCNLHGYWMKEQDI